MKYTYKKITWVNDSTPLNADNLNRMEAGISDALMNTQSLAETAKYHGDEIQTLKKTLGDDFYNEDGTRKADAPSVSDRFDENETTIEDIKKALGNDYFKGDTDEDGKLDNLNNDNTITKRLNKIGTIIRDNEYNDDGKYGGVTLHGQVQNLKQVDTKLIQEIYGEGYTTDDESRIDILEKSIGIVDREIEEGETPLKNRMNDAESDITELQREVWGKNVPSGDSRIDKLENTIWDKKYSSPYTVDERLTAIEEESGIKPLYHTQQFTTKEINGKHLLENENIPNIFRGNQKISLKGIDYSFEDKYLTITDNNAELSTYYLGSHTNLFPFQIVESLMYFEDGTEVDYYYDAFAGSNFPVVVSRAFSDSVTLYKFKNTRKITVYNKVPWTPLCLLIRSDNHSPLVLPLTRGDGVGQIPDLEITIENNLVYIKENMTLGHMNGTLIPTGHMSIFGNTTSDNKRVKIELPENYYVEALIYPMTDEFQPGNGIFNESKEYDPDGNYWSYASEIFDREANVFVKFHQESNVLNKIRLDQQSFDSEHFLTIKDIDASKPIQISLEGEDYINDEVTIELRYVTDSNTADLILNNFSDADSILGLEDYLVESHNKLPLYKSTNTGEYWNCKVYNNGNKECSIRKSVHTSINYSSDMFNIIPLGKFKLPEDFFNSTPSCNISAEVSLNGYNLEGNYVMSKPVTTLIAFNGSATKDSTPDIVLFILNKDLENYTDTDIDCYLNIEAK